jgi:hypothetical protein
MPMRSVFGSALASATACIVALTAKLVIGVVRRNRALAKIAGGGFGGGTRRHGNGWDQPGRCTQAFAGTWPFCNALRSASTLHPTGETAPKPFTKRRLIQSSGK